MHQRKNSCEGTEETTSFNLLSCALAVVLILLRENEIGIKKIAGRLY